MVQQQLPSATSLFSPMLKMSQITQTTNCASATSGGESLTPSSSTLWTLMEHSFPPSPVREAREGVPGRPQLPNRRCVRLHFHRGDNRAGDLLAMATQ